MPTTVRIEGEGPLEWWRPLVQWLLTVPHAVYLGALLFVGGFATLVTVVTVVFTGRVPAGPARFQVLVLRQRVRTFTSLWLLRRSFPPFATGLVADDPGDDPVVTVSITPPATAPRAAPLVRPLQVLPQGLVLLPIGILLDLLYPLWALVAVVNRGWPAPVGRFLVALEVWVVEILAYAGLASEHRPTFGFASRFPHPTLAATNA